MINLRLQRTLAAVAGTALMALAGGALAQQQPVAAKSAEIVIANFKFVPQTLTVAPGTSVTWDNRDEEPHNIVNVDQPRRFRSQAIDGGEKYTFVFDQPGIYKYICAVHPHMEGTVIVK
jgi:plastocyanin